MNLESPDTVLRAYIQASGCFTLIRGRGMASASSERELPSDPSSGSRADRLQLKNADYYLEVGIEQAASGSAIPGLSGLLGASQGNMVGGIAIKKREANVTLSVVNSRTTETMATTRGSARKPDVSFGGDKVPEAAPNGYRTTDLGRIYARAYLDAYSRLVEQARRTTGSSGPFSGQTPDAPFLPWPPPSPSGLGEATHLFQPSGQLGGFDNQIRARLAARGYENLRHFAVPGGFGITTDVERINQDGSPAVNRWQLGKRPASGGLLSYLTSFFAGEEGRFRLFAFLVTNQEPVPANYTATQMDIDRWKTSGRPHLSPRMSALQVESGTKVWVLVYEFQQDRSKGGKLVAPEQDGLPYSKHAAFLGIQ